MTKRARGLHDDPLSAASAGLVALGIDRARRVDVLEVLGCLLDHADASGHVVLDRVLFAREEALGVDKCLDAYALLERLDVVTRTDKGWAISDYRWHAGPEGETEASMAVLRKHLASIGTENPLDDLGPVPPELAPVPEPVMADVLRAPVPLRRWRRAVPVAAGVAASAAAVFGITQFVPQAAVSGRNAAHSAQSPTSVGAVAPLPTTAVPAAAPGVPTSAGAAPTTLAGNGPGTTTGPGSLGCVVPSVVTTVTSVEVVRVPLAGARGSSLWAAVVNGNATLTNATSSMLLPALNVVAHLPDGDTDPVQATLTAPLLVPDKAAPFSAVIALGSIKPLQPITATASAAGLKTSC